jgi:flagellar hook assembly protein FlgD
VTPNPFNPQTSLKFEVGGDQPVNSAVVIYDLRGREVRELYRGVLEPGLRTLVWNGQDNSGRSLASGIYLAQVQVSDETRTVKMTLAR